MKQLFLAAIILAAAAAGTYGISTTVVINEVYGGAGCGTAGCSTYQNDFIELKNISTGLANISGWSVQYAAATGTAWQVTPIGANVVLRPGDTFLIAESFGANGVNPLPTPNVTGTIAMSATAAKVALVNSTTALTGACPAMGVGSPIIDLVGFGATANCFETAVAPTPGTTTSISRNALGLDSDNNSTDFTAGAPTPAAAAMATAAGTPVGGRVVSAEGNGIARVFVTLVSQSGETRTALSSPFGYFSFDDVSSGETYVLSVQSKTYRFAQASQAITVNDPVNIVITAEP
jgi:uncharacterized protein